MLSNDNLRNRSCIFYRAARIHFTCSDFAGLSVPQTLNADCTVIVHFKRCTDSKQHLRKVFAPRCNRKPTVQLDVGNVGLHITGQRLANVRTHFAHSFAGINTAIVVGFIQQANGRGAGKVVSVDRGARDCLHIKNPHLISVMVESQWGVTDKLR